MRYRKLGPSEMDVSVVSLGTWVLGGDNWGRTDDTQSLAAIKKAIDLGINFIDTASNYGMGHSEEVVGKAIKGRRERVFIATKCGIHKRGGRFIIDLTPSEIRKQLESSLLRLGIERVDLYQCHWPDPNTPIEDTLAEMVKMQSEGKINYIGVSNFDLPLLERALKAAPVISLQPHFSLLERSIEKLVLPYCKEKGIGVVSYGSLGSGILSGKYKKQPIFTKNDARSFFYPFYKEPYWSLSQALVAELKKIAQEKGRPVAQIVINWIVQQSGVTTALVGARTPEQVEMNAAAGDWELSEEELKRIESVYHRIFKGQE